MHSLSLVFHKLAVHAVNKPVSAGCGRCEFDLSTSPKVFQALATIGYSLEITNGCDDKLSHLNLREVV